MDFETKAAVLGIFITAVALFYAVTNKFLKELIEERSRECKINREKKKIILTAAIDDLNEWVSGDLGNYLDDLEPLSKKVSKLVKRKVKFVKKVDRIKKWYSALKMFNVVLVALLLVLGIAWMVTPDGSGDFSGITLAHDYAVKQFGVYGANVLSIVMVVIVIILSIVAAPILYCLNLIEHELGQQKLYSYCYFQYIRIISGKGGSNCTDPFVRAFL